MALKPTTGLETHPVGTTGLNGVINGNWDRLEAIFAPLTTGGGSDIQIGWDGPNKTFRMRPAQAALTYAASMALDFVGAMAQTVALTGNATLTTTQLAAGRQLTVVFTADATPRNFTWPAWKWIGGAAPASIAASKTGILTLLSTGTTDGAVLARWSVEP